MFANIVAAMKGAEGPKLLQHIQARIGGRFGVGRQLIAILDEHFGYQKELMGRKALNELTKLRCTRMAELENYLTMVRLIFLRIVAGGESITDNMKVVMIQQHLQGLNGVSAPFAAFRLLAVSEQTYERLMKMLDELVASHRARSDADGGKAAAVKGQGGKGPNKGQQGGGGGNTKGGGQGGRGQGGGQWPAKGQRTGYSD